MELNQVAKNPATNWQFWIFATLCIAGSCTVHPKTTGKALLAAESSRKVRSRTDCLPLILVLIIWNWNVVLLQVYAPSNEAEYREYREWFLAINTASGGDRWGITKKGNFFLKKNVYKVKPQRFHDHWLPLSDEDEEGVWRHYETGEVRYLFWCRKRQKDKNTKRHIVCLKKAKDKIDKTKGHF